MSLQKIGLKNFRFFKEQTDFELAPITVFTGPNNSGKSTAIKALILLSESAKNSDFFYLLKTSTETGYVASSKIKNDLVTEKDIAFNFSFLFKKNFDYYDTDYFMEYAEGYFDKIIDIELAYSKINNPLLELINFKVKCSNETLLEFLNNGEIQSFRIDIASFHKKIYSHLKKRSFDETYFDEFDTNFQHYREHLLTDKFQEKNAILINSMDKIMERLFLDIYNGNELPLSCQSLTDSLGYLQFRLDEKKNDYAKNAENEIDYIEDSLSKLIANLKIKNFSVEMFNSLKSAYWLVWGKWHKAYFELISLLIKISKKEIEDSTNYFPTFRHEPMSEFSRTIKNNLAQKLFYIIDNDKKIRGKIIIAQRLGAIGQGALIFTNDVVKNVYKLGNKVVFKPNSHNGNYELSIISDAYKEGINIADLGSGVYHLISLLVSIEIAIIDGGYYGWREGAEFANSALLVEEPEISLHPNFQSKLADVFALANKKYGVNFIIETHSEYLIRKLQFLTATKEFEYKLNTKDSIVYYLSGETPKKINILKDGSLSDDFGKGFYDEAIGLKLELLSLKNQN